MSRFLGATNISEIIILDSGEIPVIEDESLITVLDALKDYGIPFKYLRDKPRGIGPARYRLLEEARTDRAIMIDDDVMVSGNFIREVTRFDEFTQEFAFRVPCCWIATDYLGVKDLDRTPKTALEALEIAGSRHHILPYMRYVEGSNFISDIRYCGTQCIDLSVHLALQATELKNWRKGAPREDTYLTKMLADVGDQFGMHGALVTNAYSYHLEHNTQKREWANHDEVVGYEAILRGDISGFVEGK